MTFIKDLHFKMLEHVQPSTGNFSGQISTTAYVDISGTSFSFDCNTNSGYTKVLFEISVQIGWGPDAFNNTGDLKILESTDQSNWSDIDKSKVRIAMAASYHDSTFEHKFTVAPWSGTKYFKAQIKAANASTDFFINKRGYSIYNWLSPPVINVKVI